VTDCTVKVRAYAYAKIEYVRISSKIEYIGYVGLCWRFVVAAAQPPHQRAVTRNDSCSSMMPHDDETLALDARSAQYMYSEEYESNDNRLTATNVIVRPLSTVEYTS